MGKITPNEKIKSSPQKSQTIGAEITAVTAGGLADELGLKAGDKILAVNDERPNDMIDFRFSFADEYIELLVEHENGEREIISFEKDYDEELSCEFASAVFDGIRTCRNNCIFCFVNMLARGMRRSLFVKDDDYRLSFLFGNFVTLDNLQDADYERISKMHLSPLYVSVHTTNGALRAKMLRNENAANILSDIDRLLNTGIKLHTQIVLCRGVNDGEELMKTVSDLAARRLGILSVAVVPVGQTCHRRDDFPLQSFDGNSAKAVISWAKKIQAQFRRDCNRTFFYLADEFYLAAGEPLPPAEYYDGYPQIENGIGLSRSFAEDFAKCRVKPKQIATAIKILILCGTAIAPLLASLAVKAQSKRPGLSVKTLPVENVFFGGNVNVSGLLTGQDLLNAAKKINDDFAVVLIPGTALKKGDDIFLDDMSLNEFAAHFDNAKILPVTNGDEYKKILYTVEAMA